MSSYLYRLRKIKSSSSCLCRCVRACALSRSFEPSFRLTENAEEASPQKGRKLRVTSLLADLRTGKKLSFGLKTFFPRPVTADCARHPARRARCACVLALTSRSDKTTTVGLAPTGTTSHCLCACLQARTRGRAEVQMHARAGRATKSWSGNCHFISIEAGGFVSPVVGWWGWKDDRKRLEGGFGQVGGGGWGRCGVCDGWGREWEAVTNGWRMGVWVVNGVLIEKKREGWKIVGQRLRGRIKKGWIKFTKLSWLNVVLFILTHHVMGIWIQKTRGECELILYCYQNINL